ncbi:MAG: trehalose-phosphatase [Vulcanococcus sp.]
MSPLPALLERACNAPAVLLYLDFDGTLAHLRGDPDLCALPASLRPVLEALSALPHFDLAVISGRSLEDLRKRLALQAEAINLSGNHGLELLCGGERWSDPRAEALRPQLDQWALGARQLLADLPGARVEHKGLTLSLHERCVKAEHAGEMERRLAPLLTDLTADGCFALRRGRCVLEIRPAFPHGKAMAARRLEQNAKERGLILGAPDPSVAPLRLYFGDDQTDEDVFLHWPGVTGIRVGPSALSSAASCRLGGPVGVAHWLEALWAQLRESGDATSAAH